MQLTVWRSRIVGAASALVLAIGGTALVAAPASAALGLDRVAASTVRVIAAGKDAQPAGDIVLTVADTWSAGDTISLAVGLPGGGANCAVSGATIGYSAAPTVAVTPVPGKTAPALTVGLAASPGCLGSDTLDTAVLSFTNDGAGLGLSSFTVTVFGIAYDVGPAVPPGSVPVKATQSSGLITPTSVSNAAIRGVAFTANDPVHGVPVGPAEPVSPFVLTEIAPGAVGAGTVVFTIDPAGSPATFVTGASAPSVRVNGGGADVSPSATVTPTTVSFTVHTPSSGSPATYTVSGVVLDTTASRGPVLVDAGIAATSPSAAAPTAYGEQVVATAATALGRLAGTDRYATASAIFTAGFGCPAGAASKGVADAVLARGDAFPDALAGNYLAGTLSTGTLLTAPDAVPAPTLAALKSAGVRRVFVLGGTAAISDAVTSTLASTPAYGCDGTQVASGLTVVRVAGTDRYDTARLVADQPGPSAVGTLDLGATGSAAGAALPTAILADGLGFADALAAGPMSYQGTRGANGSGAGFPTLLTAPDVLSPPAAAALTALGIKQVIIPGGTAAVSDTVAQQVAGLGITVTRIAGADRGATAAMLAAFETAAATGTGGARGLSFPAAAVALARGDDFADALAGGPLAGATNQPILLAQDPGTLGAATTSYLHAAAGRTTEVTVFGGTSALSGAAVQAALDALTGG